MQNSKCNLHFHQSRRSRVTYTFAVAVPAERLLQTAYLAQNFMQNF